MSTDDDGHRARVDQQDGGPGSHTGNGSGGEENDVASGGISERADDGDTSRDNDLERDVHGDPDAAG